MTQQRVLTCAAAIVAVALLSGCSRPNGSVVRAGNDVCAGILPAPAVNDVDIDISILTEQLFRTELSAEYESKFSRVLDDDALSEWVFTELACQTASLFEDEELKFRFIEMQYLARTNPDALIPWVKENPAGSAEPPSMIEVPDGECRNWSVVFTADGRMWLHGEWMQLGTRSLIPRQDYAAYMERMACLKRL